MVVPQTELITYLLTIPLEAQIEALRVGVANITPMPYRLDGMCCCEGSGWNSASDAQWAYFTFTGAGGEPREPARAPESFMVPGIEGRDRRPQCAGDILVGLDALSDNFVVGAAADPDPDAGAAAVAVVDTVSGTRRSCECDPEPAALDPGSDADCR